MSPFRDSISPKDHHMLRTSHKMLGLVLAVHHCKIVKYDFNLRIIRFETLCAVWDVLSHIMCFRQAVCAVLYVGNVAVI